MRILNAEKRLGRERMVREVNRASHNQGERQNHSIGHQEI